MTKYAVNCQKDSCEFCREVEDWIAADLVSKSHPHNCDSLPMSFDKTSDVEEGGE